MKYDVHGREKRMERALAKLRKDSEIIQVNKKAVYRVLKLKGWFVNQRTVTPRPRVRGRRSRAERSNQRWA